MGTPAYMSPEQIAGRSVDHRTDIFSGGILLYQMCTGERPFAGSTSIELASAILRDIPPALDLMRPDVPPDLARLVRRGLEKDPQRRVQTARDVANQLREIARSGMEAPSGGTGGRRVADVGGSSRNETGFWVAIQPFKYAGANADLSALAEALTLRAETYSRSFSTGTGTGDAYGVLPHTMSQVVRSKPIDQLSPYEALLRSFVYAERVTVEEHVGAKAALEQAVHKSPRDSDCWAMLSIMLADEYGHGFGAHADTLERAVQTARRAVDANPRITARIRRSPGPCSSTRNSRRAAMPGSGLWP